MRCRTRWINEKHCTEEEEESGLFTCILFLCFLCSCSLPPSLPVLSWRDSDSLRKDTHRFLLFVVRDSGNILETECLDALRPFSSCPSFLLCFCTRPCLWLSALFLWFPASSFLLHSSLSNNVCVSWCSCTLSCLSLANTHNIFVRTVLLLYKTVSRREINTAWYCNMYKMKWKARNLISVSFVSDRPVRTRIPRHQSLPQQCSCCWRDSSDALLHSRVDNRTSLDTHGDNVCNPGCRLSWPRSPRGQSALFDCDQQSSCCSL